MSRFPRLSARDVNAAWAARPATTYEAVRDYPANLPAVARAVLRDSDGLDLDDVEHVRQNRLKRWQTPPTTTGTER